MCAGSPTLAGTVPPELREYVPRDAAASPLYAAVAESLETFLAAARARDRNVRAFVERELRDYLNCGIAAHGFLRVHCSRCGLDRLVPYSCKERGYAQSWNTRSPEAKARAVEVCHGDGVGASRARLRIIVGPFFVMARPSQGGSDAGILTVPGPFVWFF